MSYHILMGLDQKMDWDFKFMIHTLKLGVSFYSTSTPKALGKYREYTPFNKGNLWKIRYYYKGHFKVFYGTKEKAYCTSLPDCLNIAKQ